MKITVLLSFVVAGIALLVWPDDLSAQIERVSVASDGSQASNGSYQASVSDDGQVIAFRSNADGLVGGDVNDLPDIFVRDLMASTTEKISTAIDPNEQALYNRHSWTSISDDGSKIAYQATPGAYQSIRVFDRADASTLEIFPVIASGSIDSEARQRPLLSGNGQWVAFYSSVTFQGSEPPGARPAADDTNGAQDVFVYDIETMPTPAALRLSRDALGVQGNAASIRPSISDGGQFVVFESWADNLVPANLDVRKSDVFLKDRISGAIDQISVSAAGLEGDADSLDATISGNGEWIAFRSRASNLVSGDNNGRWDIYLRDRALTMIERISVASGGGDPNRDSFSPSLSDDGRFVSFHSSADNLVDDDGNQRSDIFVFDRQTDTIALVSRNPLGDPANGHSTAATLSGDGRWIVFESDATDLVPGDTNQARDIFRALNPLSTAP